MTLQIINSKGMPTGRGFELFDGGIKSVQSGILAVPQGEQANSFNITIGQVDVAKSFVVLEISNSTAGASRTLFTGELANSTTLNIQRDHANTDYDSVKIAWKVIELSSGKVQKISQILYTANTDINISPANINKSFTVCSTRIYGLNINQSGSTENFMLSSMLTQNNIVTVSKVTSQQSVAVVYIVEFN